MISDDEMSLWESIKRTLTPLFRNRVQEPVPFPKRLRVHAAPKRELLSVLDLHGLTVEQAYQTLRQFLVLHVRARSKTFTVITGKGSKTREGLIHHEMAGWLDTPFFKNKIRSYEWLNGGGAIKILLKKEKTSR